MAEGARLESVCIQKVPRVRIPPSPLILGARAVLAPARSAGAALLRCPQTPSAKLAPCGAASAFAEKARACGFAARASRERSGR